MKKMNVYQIISIISCVMLVISFMKISSLTNQVTQLQNSMNNQLSNVNSSISQIYSNVENMMEEQTNLLETSEWTFGKPNLETGTVVVQCSIVPKEYSPEKTSATLLCNGKEYPMELSNGKYLVDVSIPLFEDSTVTTVQFQENGMVRTESLDWYLSPRWDCLPSIYAHFDGSSTGKIKGNAYIKDFDGQIVIHTEMKGNNVQVESIALLEYLDGKEISRTNVPLNTAPYETTDGTNISMETVAADSSAYPSEYYYLLDKKVEIPFGSTYEIYTEVVDDCGLHYRNLVDREVISKTGASSEAEYWGHEEANIYDIYDENGKALFSIE